MKKMLCAATAVIICNIGLTGCGGSASNAHPEDYFTEIRAEMQGDFDVGRAAIQDKYRDEGLAALQETESEDGYRYTFQNIQIDDSKTVEQIEIDLSEYREQAEGFTDNEYFYDEKKNAIYFIFDPLPATDQELNSSMEETEEKLLMVLVVYQLEDGSCELIPYTSDTEEGLWFTEGYCLGDNIYENTGKADVIPYVLNKTTKEVRKMDKEYEQAEAEIEKYKKEKGLDERQTVFFTPVIDDGTCVVVAVDIAPAMDLPEKGCIYMVFEEQKLLDSMVIWRDGEDDVTDANIEKAMAVVWHEFDEGNNDDITTERTYKQYLSGLKYDEKLQEANKLSDENRQGKVIYLQADVVSVLAEGEGWDSVVEYPNYGYWLVQEDSEAGFRIVERGY